MWCERAENGLEVMHVFREGRIFEGLADAECVERDFDGGVLGDGEAEEAGGVGRAGIRESGVGIRGRGISRAEERHCFGGRRLGSVGFVGWVGGLFGDCSGIFEDCDCQAAGRE
jgi:hypothetical protein